MMDGVEVRHIDNAKGKGLFAKQHFARGAVIFVEKPLVCCQFSWNKAYKYIACDNCLKPLETAQENARRLTGNAYLELPYMDCCTTDKDNKTQCDQCDTAYCSEDCKKLAYEQYHQLLCCRNEDAHPIKQLEDAWKQMHYPPETNSVMLVIRLLARILQSKNRELATQETLQFCHRTVNEDANLAHKLLGDRFANQLCLLYELYVAALPHEGIEQFLTLSGFQSLLSLIGTNGQGVGTSPISQWVTKTTQLSLSESEKQALDKFVDKLYDDLDAQSGNFLNNEGVALFSLLSACNHSCVPNAEPSYLHNNSTLSLVAVEDIKPGEEIFISYLDECNLERSRHTRQKSLMENYLFKCNCKKCEEQAADADVTSEEESDDEVMSE